MRRILFTFLAVLLLSLTGCGGDEIIHSYKKHFLLVSGKARGQLGTPGNNPNQDIIPIPTGHISIEKNMVLIIDQFNRKIMLYTITGRLRSELPLPEKVKNSQISSLNGNDEGEWFFLSANNTTGSRTFTVWMLKNNSLREIVTRKPHVSEKAVADGTEQRLSIPSGLLPLGDSHIGILWSTMTRHLRKNQFGQEESLGSKYSISSLEQINLATKTNTIFRIDEKYFSKQNSKTLQYNSITQVLAGSSGEYLLVKAQYRHRKEPRMVKKLFRISLDNGKTTAISLDDHRWSALLGLSDSGLMYLLDRVYTRNGGSRARISSWSLSGTKHGEFTIESRNDSNSLGALFFSRKGILYSYELIRKTVYNRTAGLRLVSWE